MKKPLVHLFFWGILLMNFYILPLLIQDTASAMTLLLVVMPLICLAVSVFYGFTFGFHLWYPLSVGLLFIPSIWIHYNLSAWIYIFLFALVSLLGMSIGWWTGKRKKEPDQGYG